MELIQCRKSTEKNISPEAARILGAFSRTVAEVFMSLRKAKGYTSYENFAFTNNFPRAQYWRVEDGEGNLTLRTLSRLLAIHNLTLMDFFELLIEEQRSHEIRSIRGGEHRAETETLSTTDIQSELQLPGSFSNKSNALDKPINYGQEKRKSVN